MYKKIKILIISILFGILNLNAAMADEITDNEDITLNGLLDKEIFVDFTGDGVNEVFISEQIEGSGNILNYRVYEKNEGKLKLIFERENIERGTVEIKDNSIIEKIPIYKEDDPFSSPSSLIISEYIYQNDRFILNKSIEKEVSKYSAKISKSNINLSQKEAEELIEKVALEKGIPPVILKSISYTESGFRQFDKNGEPLLSFDGLSWGIMQISPKFHPEYDVEKLKYDVEYNIRAGADILLGKWNYAFKSKPTIPIIGDGDPRILENWYFTIWAYNGWSKSNNPNVLPIDYGSWIKKEAYQDKVLKVASEKFNTPITTIKKEDLPKDSCPSTDTKFSTPSPIHFGEFNLYNPNETVISTASSGIAFYNDNWEKISYIDSDVLMKIIEGPKVYNGYLRYKVELVKEGTRGWVPFNWIKKVEDIEEGTWKEIVKSDSVLPNKEWIIRLNSEVLAESINDENIYVLDSNYEKVKIDINIGEDNKSIIVKPYNEYINGENYYLYITNNLKSIKNKSLKYPIKMKFNINNI